MCCFKIYEDILKNTERCKKIKNEEYLCESIVWLILNHQYPERLSLHCSVEVSLWKLTLRGRDKKDLAQQGCVLSNIHLLSQKLHLNGTAIFYSSHVSFINTQYHYLSLSNCSL